MIVTDQHHFDRLLEELSQCSAVAVDTEFLWTKTYHANLALVQFSGGGTTFAMDPLAIKDFSGFKKFLENPDVIKVFHSCEQDLMILENSCDAKVYPLFDTQIAMGLCGYDAQVSYRTFVEELCGVELDKGSQFSDWLKRPLSAKQQEYALNDVTYLIDAYPKVKRKLEELKRIPWFNEDVTYYTDDSFYEVTPDDQRYRSIKGAGRLKSRNLAVLKQLCEWREDQGRKKDLRPRMILKDDIMLNICYGMPTSVKGLNECRVPSFVPKKYGDLIVAMVEKALAMNEEELPEVLKGEAPTDRFRKDFAKMAKVIDAEAEKINISSQVLLTRKKARAILYKSQEEKRVCLEKLTGWRFEILLKPLTSVIENLI